MEGEALRKATFPDVMPVIEGLIEEGDKLVLVAEPAVGKSILAQQIAHCIAGGHALFGDLKVPKKRKVLYLNAEGKKRDIHLRIEAMNTVLPVEEGMIYWGFAGNFAIDTPEGSEAIMQVIEDKKPEVVIYDPLYMAMVGSLSDEKESRSAQAMFNDLYIRYGITQFVPTHPPKPNRSGDNFMQKVDKGDDNIFGSRFWEAWADTTLHLGRREDKRRALKVMKDKTGRLLGDSGYWREPILLNLVEPMPLFFDIGSARKPSFSKVDAYLKANAEESYTYKQLKLVLDMGERTVYDAVEFLEEEGSLRRLGGQKPVRFQHNPKEKK